MYPRELKTYVHTNTGRQMLAVALFTTVLNQKQFNEAMKSGRSVIQPLTDYHRTIKSDGVLIQAMWPRLENTVTSGRQPQRPPESRRVYK